MKEKALLSLMMFLQYMMLPVWFVPMLPYVQAMPGGSEWTVWCGFIMGFGTFASPLFGMFAAGSAVAVTLGVLSFALPPTPPVAKGSPMSPVDALGLRAAILLKEPAFRRFALLLLLAMVPFQWYNVYCAAYLKETGFRYLTLTVNLGQVGEIGFMLLVPWIIARFGFRKALLIGLAALAFRNACFLLASGWGLPAFDFGGILIHGLIFGILIVGSQMHVNEIVPADLRGQAQGFLNIITAGVGVFVSNGVFHAVLGKTVPHAWTLAYAVALTLSLAGVAFASRAWSSPSAPGSRP